MLIALKTPTTRTLTMHALALVKIAKLQEAPTADAIYFYQSISRVCRAAISFDNTRDNNHIGIGEAAKLHLIIFILSLFLLRYTLDSVIPLIFCPATATMSSDHQALLPASHFPLYYSPRIIERVFPLE